jgi:hypothetical protein
MAIVVNVSGSIFTEQEWVAMFRDVFARYAQHPATAKPIRVRCAAVKRSGEQCRFFALPDEEFCRRHGGAGPTKERVPGE